jgi:hypothetical protein
MVMTAEEAGRVLREMYDNAEEREKAAHIHLFGIMYSDELDGLTNTDIVREAGIAKSYHSEVAKGRKLAKYVTVKE